MPTSGKNGLNPNGLPTGQNTPKSNFFCQESLTKNRHWVQNIDKTISFLKMAKLDKSALAGALMLGGAMISQPALAEDKRPSIQLASMTNDQIENCVGFVKEQRTLAADNGVTMSRKDQKSLLHQCNNGQLEARIAEQEQILAALDEEIHQLDLKLDEQGQILDEQGRVLAKIIAINGQLIIRKQELNTEIAASRTRQDELLQQAGAILQRLATS